MKKLLVLAFVLGLSSLANATILSWSISSVTVNIGDTVTVQLIANNAAFYDAKWVGNDPTGIAEIQGITALAAAGPDAKITEYSKYHGWYTVEALDFNLPSDVLAGTQYNVTIKGLSAGIYVISSDYFEQDDGRFGGPSLNDLLTITVPATTVPEPATIALLCFGGLMLRRRK